MEEKNRRAASPAPLCASCWETTGPVQHLLVTHGMIAPPDHLEALANSVRRLRKPRASHPHALASRDRARALASIGLLLRHMEKPPRRATTTDKKRATLIEQLDDMHAIVKLAAPSGFNTTSVLRRLEAGTHTAEDLASLQRAIEALPAGTGAAASPEADYLRLLRGGVMVWEANCRSERYTFNQYNTPPTLVGPLPDFLRELITLAHLPVPSDEALHKHLRKLKNL